MRLQRSADVVVLPKEAGEAQALEGRACTGAWHTWREARYLDELRGMAGVAQATPQFFRLGVRGCCSVAVQLIVLIPRPISRFAHGAGEPCCGDGLRRHPRRQRYICSCGCDADILQHAMPRGRTTKSDGDGDGYGSLYEYGDDACDDSKMQHRLTSIVSKGFPREMPSLP